MQSPVTCQWASPHCSGQSWAGWHGAVLRRHSVGASSPHCLQGTVGPQGVTLVWKGQMPSMATSVLGAGGGGKVQSCQGWQPAQSHAQEQVAKPQHREHRRLGKGWEGQQEGLLWGCWSRADSLSLICGKSDVIMEELPFSERALGLPSATPAFAGEARLYVPDVCKGKTS